MFPHLNKKIKQMDNEDRNSSGEPGSVPLRKTSKVLSIEDIINPQRSSSPSRPKSKPRAPTVPEKFDPVERIPPNNFVRFQTSRVVLHPPSVSVIPENSILSNGHVNQGYMGSTNTMRTDSVPNVNVYREQYWNCGCSCPNNWSKRERMLLIALGVLSLIILSLVAVISVFAKGDTIRPPSSWVSWTL